MAKQEFIKFKQEVKAWLDEHVDEYDDFIFEMSQKPFSVMEKIYRTGMTLAPKLMKKAKLANHGDIVMTESQLEEFVGDSNLGKILVDEFHNLRSKSILPCLLAWLYFGKCYEMMVYFMDKERTTSKSFVEKLVYKTMIKFMVWGSVNNKSRTKEDWRKWNAEQASFNSGELQYLAFGEIFNQPDKDNSSNENSLENNTETLSDYLVDETGDILKRIKERVCMLHEGTDLAHLYIALQSESLLRKCDRTKFHKLLQQELPNTNLNTVRNFQVALRKQYEEVNGKPLYLIGADKKAIDSMRNYLKGQSTEWNKT